MTAASPLHRFFVPHASSPTAAERCVPALCVMDAQSILRRASHWLVRLKTLHTDENSFTLHIAVRHKVRTTCARYGTRSWHATAPTRSNQWRPCHRTSASVLEDERYRQGLPYLPSIRALVTQKLIGFLLMCRPRSTFCKLSASCLHIPHVRLQAQLCKPSTYRVCHLLRMCPM
ncbi:uncharacterized protein CC84DRAFT_562204 [Paraphaeosphaeria sporulosa]|uniref:Uncharacterized protein n=1 Tax=Paraphaeosphaeria sporulosa TaxID=1460663 RepID=A0A177CN12_9PLEO|nr:uncharacterized protein CC84DRAFT_562204 [Paraphaeosphaeria sporulosa]OAG08189.1 hypothetical protein CC84DRAFT_562204 [Paraphaeosphaeria sporulosa]